MSEWRPPLWELLQERFGPDEELEAERAWSRPAELVPDGPQNHWGDPPGLCAARLRLLAEK